MVEPDTPKSNPVTLKSKPSRRLLFLYINTDETKTQSQFRQSLSSIYCRSTAAASNLQDLLPTLFYTVYGVSDHCTSISFLGLLFLFVVYVRCTNCSVSFFRLQRDDNVSGHHYAGELSASSVAAVYTRQHPQSSFNTLGFLLCILTLNLNDI